MSKSVQIKVRETGDRGSSFASAMKAVEPVASTPAAPQAKPLAWAAGRVCGACVHRIEERCHRFPPQVSFSPYNSFVALWPAVTADAKGCGEFKGSP